jgi:prepilin-type N-terminal cleavage/methylation domain-containing protein
MGRTIPPRNGFTLIELLVVIAILAMLVAILMPGLSRAMDIARFTLCRSHMRTASVAWHGFAASHEGWYPGFATSSVESSPPGWANILNREYYHDNNYRCYPTTPLGDEPTCGPLLRFWNFWGGPTYPNAQMQKKWMTCPSYRAWGSPPGASNIWSRPWVANYYAAGWPGGRSGSPYFKIITNPQSVHPNYTAYRLGALEEIFKAPASKYLMWDAESQFDIGDAGGTPSIMLVNVNPAYAP